MITEKFIKVDNRVIDLSKAIAYLQNSGQFDNFVSEIIRQYVIEQELSKVEISEDLVEKTIDRFCKSNQLTPIEFQQWLERENQSLDTFHEEITQGIKLQELIARVTDPKLSEYFIDKKLQLDRIILSRLIVKELELAEELKSQIVEEEESFELLAQEYSLAKDRLFNGMMGTISRGKLPDNLRAAIDRATVKDIVGPLEIDNLWCLFRIEQILPASLENEHIQEQLREEIFEDWLVSKIQKLEIKINLTN